MVQLLSSSRLVTLTGVGGVGKTRLAIEAARIRRSEHDDGVVFLDLAPLADPGLLAGRVAVVLDIREQAGISPVELLIDHLRSRDLLLVLDNCEHVRDACAELVERLLTGAPAVRILATSRETLGVPGELDCPVPPLTLAVGEGTDAIRASEAVQLFLARAKAARPGLLDDDASLAIAAAICADLDGLPLAMELAAAHASTSWQRPPEPSPGRCCATAQYDTLDPS